MTKKTHYDRKCKNCNTAFVAHRPHAIYCSSSCRMEYWRKGHPTITAEERKQILDKLNIKE